MNTAVNPKTLVGAKKPQLHLVPPALIIHTAKAMENGAIKKKYGPFNWRENKVPMTCYISAIMRHVNCLLDGEDIASDSGVHHAGHIAACCGIILDAIETGCMEDDRPKKGCAGALIDRLTEKDAPAIVEKPTQLDPQRRISATETQCRVCNFVSVDGVETFHSQDCPHYQKPSQCGFCGERDGTHHILCSELNPFF